MRIIGGSLKGSKLIGPQHTRTRPTQDRTRESIFNILISHCLKNNISLEPLVVLDVFAGTGALGIEALSRGACEAYFFEKDKMALGVIQENIARFKLEDCSHMVRGDVLHVGPAPKAAQLAFFDPPYHQNLIHPAFSALFHQGWLDHKALLILEMAESESFHHDAVEVLVEKYYAETKICCARVK